MQYQIKVNMEELYRKIVLGLFLSLVFVGKHLANPVRVVCAYPAKKR